MGLNLDFFYEGSRLIERRGSNYETKCVVCEKNFTTTERERAKRGCCYDCDSSTLRLLQGRIVKE